MVSGKNDAGCHPTFAKKTRVSTKIHQNAIKIPSKSIKIPSKSHHQSWSKKIKKTFLPSLNVHCPGSKSWRLKALWPRQIAAEIHPNATFLQLFMDKNVRKFVFWSLKIHWFARNIVANQKRKPATCHPLLRFWRWGRGPGGVALSIRGGTQGPLRPQTQVYDDCSQWPRILGKM